MRLAEIDDMAQAVAEINRHVFAEYSPELQPFMQHFMISRWMVGSKANTEGWRHPTYQDLMLEHGVLRQAPFFVPDEPLFLEAELQNCYMNCFTAASELADYAYVEGFAQTSMLIVQHAWLEDPDGNLVDPTWALLGERHVIPTYYGIRFDTDFMVTTALETGWCSMFARDWERQPDFPSLRTGFIFDDRGYATGYQSTNREEASA